MQSRRNLISILLGGAVVSSSKLPAQPLKGLAAKSVLTASSARDAYHIFDEIPGKYHNGILTGSGATYDAAGDIQNALDRLDVEGNNGNLGGELYFPTGIIHISRTLLGRNWVAVIGQGRGSQIHALPDFVGTSMIKFENLASLLPVSMFSCGVKKIFLDCKGVVDNAIHAYGWQENSGARECVIQGFKKNGILIERGDGGASWTRISDCEIFGTDLSAEFGIRVNHVSLVGAFMLLLDGISITGQTGNNLDAGIYIEQDSVVARGVHFEHLVRGFMIEGVGNHSLDSVTGGPGVETLITLDASFTGTLNCQALNPNTATKFVIQNFVTGENIAASEGVIKHYNYPNYNFDAKVNAPTMELSDKLAYSTVVFDSKSHDVGGWYDAETGVATVQKSGHYHFYVQLALNCPAAVKSLSVQIITTSKAYVIWHGAIDILRDGRNRIIISGSTVARMAINDNATVSIINLDVGGGDIDIGATDSMFLGAQIS